MGDITCLDIATEINTLTRNIVPKEIIINTTSSPLGDIIDFSKNKNFYPGWGDKLADNLLKINCSTFVSLFVNRKAIEKVGLPIKDFFIWNDDYEFTLRISKYFENFLVSKIKVFSLLYFFDFSRI